MIVVTARSNPLGQRIKMNNAKARKVIAKELTAARHWSKKYVDSVLICIDEGDLEQAEYYAEMLMPVWGAISVAIAELREAQAGA